MATAIGLGFFLGLSTGWWLMMMAMALPTGIMLPELVLRFMRRSHVKALRRGVPDALDMLVVCTEAGMALESALEQVAIEMPDECGQDAHQAEGQQGRRR